ncbi:hypothetical protein ACFQ60_26230 [Streptomyces zhihengii]
MRSSLGRGLRPGVLGTFDTVVMAVAGTAPAYSIAAATAVLAGAVGVAGPAALLYCVLPMLGIVIAFGRLGGSTSAPVPRTPGWAEPSIPSSAFCPAGRWWSPPPCSWWPVHSPRGR